ADVDGVASAHPDLAPELRELWAVAQLAHLARREAVNSSTLPFHPSPDGARLASFGDFELIEELGRGGMGVVYKARQKSLDRLVALKMVREAHLATADDRERFRTEAHSAAQLKHPNIVTVYEVGTAGGQAYICMEFVA